MKRPDFKTSSWCAFCSLAVAVGRDDEEFNPAAKVDRAPQGTNANSPGDHRFRR